MEDLEMSVQFLFHKMFKRDNLSIALHTSDTNRPQLRDQIKKLIASLENKYKSTVSIMQRV